MLKAAFIQDLIMSMEPMGIAYLSSVLKEQGCLVRYFEVPRRGFLDKLKTFNPDILAYTVFSTNYSSVGRINRALKKEFPRAFSMVGGPHCSYSPEFMEEFGEIDGLCRGEGEEALGEFIQLYGNGKDYLRTKNWWFRSHAEIIRNEVRPLIADLDKVCFPDLETILQENSSLKQEPIRRMLASRGCFFHCSYCHNQAFQELYHGKGSVYRTRSVNNIIREAEEIKRKYKPKLIIFVDDIFGVRLNLDEFSSQYREKIGIPFAFNAHAQLATQDYARTIKDAGGQIATIGLENIDERITVQVLNRQHRPQELRDAIVHLKDAGIKVLANVIVGNPGETFVVALESYKFCVENKLDGATASILRPYPKTAVYEYCKKNDFLVEDNEQHFHSWGKSMIRFQNKMEQRKIENLQKFFGFLVIYPRLYPLFKPLFYLPGNFIYDLFMQIVFHFTKFRLMPFKFSLTEIYHISVNALLQFKDSLRQRQAAANIVDLGEICAKIKNSDG